MKLTQYASITAIIASLAACGGGGSETPTPPVNVTTAEGAYSGTVSGSGIASDATAIVTETGDMYVLYGRRTNDVLYVSGLVTGKGTSANGVFTSSVKDYYLGFAPTSGNLTANYVQGVSINGTVAYSTSSPTFSATSAAALPYVYAQAATLADAVGTWSVTGLLGDTGTVTLAADGKVTTSQAGCVSTGTVTPAPGARNYFRISVTVGASPCALPGVVVTGVAVVSPVANSSLKQLIFAATTADGSAATVGFGTR